MKRQFFLYLLCFLGLASQCQNAMILEFNSTHTGRNIQLSGSRRLNEKNEIGIGILYNINRIAMPDDQNNVFLKRLYADSFLQHVGADFFYHRYLLGISKVIEPYLLLNLSMSHAKNRLRSIDTCGYDPHGNTLFTESIINCGPFTWIDQYIGFGYKVKISGNFFFDHQIGGGVGMIFGNDERLPQTLNSKFEWEFGGLIHAGIGYQIPVKTKSH